MILNLWLISVVWIFGVDYSGFLAEMEEKLTKMLHSPIPLRIPKPFSCSLCLTFWTSIIYLLIVHQFSLLNLFLTAIVCFLIPTTNHLLHSVRGFIDRLIDAVDDYFNIY